MEKTSNTGIIRSVQKSVIILRHILNSPDEVSLLELEKKLGYNASTIHHILKTLILEGFVSQNRVSKKYAPGPELLFSYLTANQPEKFFHRALPLLDKNVALTGETTNIFIRQGNEAICIAGVESPQTLKAFLQIGRRIPLNATAAGKIFLAYMEEKEAMDLLRSNSLKQISVSVLEKLLLELQTIRQQGYSIESNEFDDMVTAIGAPIFDGNNRLIAATSAIVPSTRIDEDKINMLVSSLTRIAHEISEVLLDGTYNENPPP
ncbi:HTH-type transcriptional regulator XynR [Sporomusa rhizae]|uniref:IclR family transcriptional regulator n=1 Tax=Sporomusa rhizae TaxID=357999 RepID=UPI00352B9418